MISFSAARAWVIIGCLLIGPTLSFAVDPIRFESAPLQKSKAIIWEGRRAQTIDAVEIEADPSITLRRCSDIVISTSQLRSIKLENCERITIRNGWLHDSDRIAVDVYRSRQVTVEGCRIENVVNGVYAVESQSIVVIGNFVRNVRGPYPRGQMVQFNNVTGPGNRIQFNYAINERGKSGPEDVINIYQSEGTKDSPLRVENNYLVGDPRDGSEDKSPSGSGIMLADCGGAYQLCRDNVILSAGQVGIGVAGGHDIHVTDNRIYGAKSNVSNVGLYVWNQSEKPGGAVRFVCNRVWWINKSGEQNAWWDGGGMSPVYRKGNIFADTSLSKDLPPPPSPAPQPPMPDFTSGPDGARVARVPWPVEK